MGREEDGHTHRQQTAKQVFYSAGVLTDERCTSKRHVTSGGWDFRITNVLCHLRFGLKTVSQRDAMRAREPRDHVTSRDQA